MDDDSTRAIGDVIILRAALRAIYHTIGALACIVLAMRGNMAKKNMF